MKNRESTRFKKNARYTVAVAGWVLLATAAMPAVSETPAREVVTLDIPAQPLADALSAFAQQSGLQILFHTETGNKVTAPPLLGRFTPVAALQRLLANTSLEYEFVDERTVAIRGAKESGSSKPTVDAAPLGTLRMAQVQAETAPPTSGAAASGQGSEEKQDTADSDDNLQGTKLEEIIVTAQRREQKLRDVPFAISALTTEDLERTGASGYRDILAQLPGVQFVGSSRGRSVITMRGVSTDADSMSAQQTTVEQFIDGLALTELRFPWGTTDLDPFDIERVEVLRGPQGTLFGSGAMGGAVRYITSKPNLSEFQSKIEMGLATIEGGDNSTKVAGMINAPLITDKLAIRVAAYRRHDGGWVDNVHRGEDNVNSGTETGGRVMLAYQPTDALKLGFTALYDKAIVDDNPLTFYRAADGAPDESYGVKPERNDGKLHMYSFTLDYDLERASIASITNYAKRDLFLVSDWGRLAAFFFGTDPDQANLNISLNSKRFSQEVRLTSNGEGPLEWNLGALYLDYSNRVPQVWDLGTLLWLDQVISVDIREAAVFGQATYHLTDKLSVTAGARVFENKASLETISAPGTLDDLSVPFAEKKSSSVTPKFSISFYPRADLHLYATAARGYRVGQVNLQYAVDPRIPVSYNPDNLWNYEIGIKSSWLDDRLQANVAAYNIDWKDIQLERSLPDIVTPSNHVANAGNAEIKGVEAEFVLRPVDGIEIGTSLTYTDGKLISVLPGVAATPGTPLPGTGEFKAATYIQGTARVGGDLTGYLRVAHRYVGETPTDFGNPNSFTVGSYHELDVRTGMLFKNYEVAVYVNNLADSDAVTSGTGFTFDLAPVATRLQPRTVGLTLRADF